MPVLGSLPHVPSPQHQLLTRVIPVLRRRSEVHDPEQVRRDVLAAQAKADPSPPRRVAKAFDVRQTEACGLPLYELRPAGADPVRTVLYLHGGGFVSGLDRFHWQVRRPAGPRSRGTRRAAGATR